MLSLKEMRFPIDVILSASDGMWLTAAADARVKSLKLTITVTAMKVESFR